MIHDKERKRLGKISLSSHASTEEVLLRTTKLAFGPLMLFSADVLTCMMRRNLVLAAGVCWPRMRDLENSLHCRPHLTLSPEG